jgi:predicted dehydrogenase
MPKTRVGFVGCGGIANAHLQGLSKHPDVELVAFCDVAEARASDAAAKYGAEGAKTFTNARDLFDGSELDVAYFCLPPFAHGDELIAVEKGVPFFVEKPVDLDLGRAKEIAAAVKAKNLMTAVGYMNRYRASVQKVRTMLAEDPAILMFGGWIGGTPRGSGSWWIDMNKSGGQFHEQVTHTVDIAIRLSGTPVEIHAFAATGLNRGVAPDYSIPDAIVVNMRFENNGVANLWASCSSNGGGGGVSLNVYANDFTALFTGWEQSVRILREGGKSVEEIKGEGDIFAVEDDCVIRAVRSGDRSLIQASYADGLEAARVSLGATESFRSGKPVSLR